MKATTKQIQSVIKWQYWLFNHGNPKQILVEVFDEWLGLHFYSKFCGYFDEYEQSVIAWNKLFMEMTTDAQRALVEWVLNNYEG